MHILLLTLLFAFAGVMAIAFHKLVPDGATIKQRFPIKRTRLRDIVLPLIVLGIGTLLWFTVGDNDRTAIFQCFIIALLALESSMLLLMRRFGSTITLSFMAGLCGLAAFAVSWTFKLPAIDMLLFVFGTLGAWTLAQRLGFLNVWFLMVVVLGLTAFDYYNVTSLTSTAVAAGTTVSSSSILLVSIGQEALGIGDFVFLSLCTLALIARFGGTTALMFLSIESVILLITGLVPTSNGFFFPYLLVMTPVFFAVYLIAYVKRRRRAPTTASEPSR